MADVQNGQPERTIIEPQQRLRLAAHRGFLMLCGAYLVVGVVGFFAVLLTIPREAWAEQAGRTWLRLGMFLIAAAIVGIFAWLRRKGFRDRDHLVNVTTWLVIPIGLTLLVGRILFQPVSPSAIGLGIVDLVIMHLLACALLPIEPRETLPPFVLVGLFWALAFIMPQPELEMNTFTRLVIVVISPMFFGLGLFLANMRSYRRIEVRERAQLDKQVASMGSELSRARIVHDAMFPRPFDAGHVCFEYEYRPIAEIGGDYIHLHVCRETGKIYVTLLDVAGHGLAAALTVNRLFGELERIRAENPDARPRDVMELLNRYIYLTMSRHSLFATGMSMMLDPSTGELTWVNAGHPPALLRSMDGEVNQLETTTMLLGVLSSWEFEPNEQSMTMKPGDTAIAYTDGVLEARCPAGNQFGMKRLIETAGFSPPPRDWSRFVNSAVANHHAGNADDDLLVVALTLRSLTLARPESWDDVRFGPVAIEANA